MLSDVELLNFEVEEENIYALSSAKLQELVFSQRYYRRIRYFSCRGCWSNRFKITGFKFLNVEKYLENDDFFLK